MRPLYHAIPVRHGAGTVGEITDIDRTLERMPFHYRVAGSGLA